MKTDQASGKDQGFGGSLIRKFAWDETAPRGTSKRWQVWLEPEIIFLFQENAYTRIDWEQRLALPPLAKWLHGFYYTHRDPFAFKVDTLRTLSGSRIKVLAKFRYGLREALDLLVRERFLVSYRIDPATDLLTVERAPKRDDLLAVQ